MYLVAILDWYSRYVIDWMLNDTKYYTLDIYFILVTCQKALKKAHPEIMSSDYVERKTMPKYIRKCFTTKVFIEKYRMTTD